MINPLTDEKPLNAGTQCYSILEELKKAKGKEVTLFDLWRVSGSMAVATRISNLREHGHKITCRRERVGNRIHSFYSLESTPQTENEPQLKL